MIAGWGKEEMKNRIEKYIAEVTDVSAAFSKLTKKDAEELLAQFLEEHRQVPELSLEEQLF